MLTGVPPLKLTLDILTTKFILKGLKAGYSVTAKLYQIESEPSHHFYHHITIVKRYLEWAAREQDGGLG